MPKPGDVILAAVIFPDGSGVKIRPAVVLFEEMGNVVAAGVTSNTAMKGVPLTVEEGAVKNSVIKLNYIFTITHEMVHKKLFSLSRAKMKMVFEALKGRLEKLAEG